MGLINSGTHNLNDNHGSLMNRVAVAMMVISLIATCLRLFARKLVHQQLRWDDWFIPIALAFSWGTTIIHIIAVEKGNFGRHITPATTPAEIVRFLKCLYSVQIGYPIAIAAIKFSILFFYRRIFHVGPTKLPLVLLGAVVAAWAIAMIIMGIFSCRPVKGFWMREEIPTVCMSEITYLLAVAIPNVATDIVLIVFPLPILWRLKVTTSHKIALSGIFLIGGFIVIISCLRLVTVIQSNSDPDVTWALLPLGIFNVLEMNIGILCACLPSMAPLLRILMGKTAAASNPTPQVPSGQSISSSGHKFWSRSKRSNIPGLSVLQSQNESVTWLNDAPTTQTGVVIRPKTSIHGPESSPIELEQVREDGKIRVDHNITWSES